MGLEMSLQYTECCFLTSKQPSRKPSHQRDQYQSFLTRLRSAKGNKTLQQGSVADLQTVKWLFLPL